jgi:hypothetical protein
VEDYDRTSGETESAVSDVVLIHSTGQGAAGWERVVHALTERGQTAHAVELPSDPDLLAADYAELIRRHVGAIAAPIVLAHSLTLWWILGHGTSGDAAGGANAGPIGKFPTADTVDNPALQPVGCRRQGAS